MGRTLRARPRDHAQPDRTAAGDNDDVAEVDRCPFDACSAQDSGSANAACAAGMSADTLWTMASAG